MNAIRRLALRRVSVIGQRCLATIQDLQAQELFDSQGNSTAVKVELRTETAVAEASVPRPPAMEDVLPSISNINNTLSKALRDMEVTKQADIDRIIKQHALNTTSLAVSLAAAKAGASASGQPLYQYIAQLAGRTPIMPVPMFSVINGMGKMAFQDVLVMPVGAGCFAHALQAGREVSQALEAILKDHGKSTVLSAEGGIMLDTHLEDAFHMLMRAIKAAGHEQSMRLAFDAHADQLHSGFHKYTLAGREVPDTDLFKLYVHLADKYPLASITEPFAKDEWAQHILLTTAIGHSVQIIADLEPRQDAAKVAASNAFPLHVDRMGTVTEMVEAVRTRPLGWSILLKAQAAGEDSAIGDLMVGLGITQFRGGGLFGVEHLNKYNQLLRIEEESLSADKQIKYAGLEFRQ